MKIPPKSPDSPRVAPTTPPRPLPAIIDGAPGRRRDAAPTRPDHVQLSSEARALAEADAASDDMLSPERIAELRQRVADGVYDSDEILDAVARRLVDDGY